MDHHARPSVAHILETSLYVCDISVSSQFYSRILGFPILGQEERMCALEVPGGGVLLLFRRGGSISPTETPGGNIPPHDGHGALHLCFAIPLLQLEAWERHFEIEGVTLESRVTQPNGGISLYFRDPDGHSLELGTPGLWLNY
jgi:catechol 2,3-dioxygenase-like lactoylglutathione lyase family enzyme